MVLRGVRNFRSLFDTGGMLVRRGQARAGDNIQLLFLLQCAQFHLQQMAAETGDIKGERVISPRLMQLQAVAGLW